MSETFYVPYALFVSAPGSGVDGFGHSVTGRQQPTFDTLLSVVNLTDAPVDVRYRFFHQDGTPVLWDDGNGYCDYWLPAKLAVASTLIAGNPFPVSIVGDFVGYATVECSGRCAVSAMLGGGGFYPDHWNVFSANVPVLREVLMERKFVAPYAISFKDANHGPYGYIERRIAMEGAPEPVERAIYRDFSYRTGLVITNFSNLDCSLSVSYTVGAAYYWPSAPREYRFNLDIASKHSFVGDLFTKLEEAGYPAGINSEGHVLIEGADPQRVPMIAPYLLVSNSEFNMFSAGVGFEAVP